MAEALTISSLELLNKRNLFILNPTNAAATALALALEKVYNDIEDVMETLDLKQHNVIVNTLFDVEEILARFREENRKLRADNEELKAEKDTDKEKFKADKAKLINENQALKNQISWWKTCAAIITGILVVVLGVVCVTLIPAGPVYMKWSTSEGTQIVWVNVPLWHDIESTFSSNKPEYILYTSKSSNLFDYEKLAFNPDAIKDMQNEVSKFDGGLSTPTIILSHGFLSDCFNGPSEEIFNALKASTGNFNLICVNWPVLASTKVLYIPSYRIAKEATVLVGNHTAFLYSQLLQLKITMRKKITFIGHSLGAHVVGASCKAIHLDFDYGRCAAILGLDPAAPLYVDVGRNERLDRTDGDVVNIIHSSTFNMPILLLIFPFTNAPGLGLEKPIGWNDIYLNKGFSQPGCKTSGCDHSRCITIYAETLYEKEPPFMANKCKNLKQAVSGKCQGEKWKVMNWTVSREKNILHLETTSLKPFQISAWIIVSEQQEREYYLLI